MSTTFTPTFAKDLRPGDLMRTYSEKVTVATRCDVHPLNVHVEVEGFDTFGRYDGVHSDICCTPLTVFIVRRED